MKLEQEIHQYSFQSEYQKALLNILFTNSWLMATLIRRLKPYGISPQQFNILRILRGQHPQPARVNLLRERMLDRNSNASRLVEKLRTKGLVKRTTCEEDRRSVDVAITEAGLALLAKIDAEAATWMQPFRNLRPTEARELNRLLDKLRGDEESGGTA